MKKAKKISDVKVFVIAADEQEQRMFYRVQRAFHCKTASDTIRQMLISCDKNFLKRNSPIVLTEVAQ